MSLSMQPSTAYSAWLAKMPSERLGNKPISPMLEPRSHMSGVFAASPCASSPGGRVNGDVGARVGILGFAMSLCACASGRGGGAHTQSAVALKERLKQLKDAYEVGALTEPEYHQKRKRMIDEH